MIRSRTLGGIKQVIALVSWAEIEAIAAELQESGEQVSCLRVVFGEKPGTLGDLFAPRRERLIGVPLAHYSAPDHLIQRLTENEWRKIVDPRHGSLNDVRRPWTGEFNHLPFGDPGATKVVCEIVLTWREIVHDGICYRATSNDFDEHRYQMVENLVC